MIKWKDFYTVMAAVVPLYVAMILAYGSVRWWRIFSPDQFSGINRFVAVFAVPLLSFHFIATNDPYAMNLRFVAADTLQKLIVLAAVVIWSNIPSRSGGAAGAGGGGASFDWAITIFSLSTLPNTLIMGIPLLTAMYGDFSGSLMVQVVVLQCIIWYTLLLFLFEYRAARLLILDQFPDGTAGSIVSFKVDSDVASLVDGAGDDGRSGHQFLQADAEVGDDGKIRVTVRKSTSSCRSVSLLTPRPSNLTGAEIYSLSSSRNPTPRGSNFNPSDFYSMARPTPRPSNVDDGHSLTGPAAFPNQEIAAGRNNPAAGKPISHHHHSHDAKELHMFVWSSSASPVSDVGGFHGEFAAAEQDAKEIRMIIPEDLPQRKSVTGGEEATEEGPAAEGPTMAEQFPKDGGCGGGLPMEGKVCGNRQQMPPTSVMTRLILIMVWRKLIRNPNTYSSLVGLTWSLIAFRWHIAMPKIVEQSISILSDAGLGMAMFSLGLFMALQPKIIACGNSVASFAMTVRFLTGPAVMAAASIAVGLRGTLLHIAIVQAALPQGIVPFVFAKEYNGHLWMLISLPITLLYYIVLGL
ncbi:unnamed protein product [Spirodela intermedia]|uniref:Auxin efflux carrier component n=1 Tax=Spirodela intermedia TaxID=51605 RepID=A0A7I8J609_SPIIN|nr:unnamed protein product [Spirodela intermedia]CAA6665479.1 unnamed protein product [Spirodela intermedia]